jgi:hypothetical protein
MERKSISVTLVRYRVEGTKHDHEAYEGLWLEATCTECSCRWGQQVQAEEPGVTLDVALAMGEAFFNSHAIECLDGDMQGQEKPEQGTLMAPMSHEVAEAS